MTLTVIKNGEVYSPKAIGVQSILTASEKIQKVGTIDEQKLLDLGLACNVIDAAGCVVVPGIIDPHAHIIGAGGEKGFTSRMPELDFERIVLSGITTIVGLVGTDTTTRSLSSLYAKANQLEQEGITAFIYTGGFTIPVSTITGSLKDDLVLIDKVIGSGEIAISDDRWVDPDLHELAVVVAEAMLGGMQSGKAGVTHFHVGEGKKRLSLLHELLDQFEMPPETLYITHIERSQALLDDAIRIAKRGAYVDIDTVEEDQVAESLDYYLEHGGPADRLTISSDANTPGGGPEKLFARLRSIAREGRIPLENLLPHFTSNAARALKLKFKGSLEEEMDADILVLRKGTFELVHLLARGQHLVKDGQVTKRTSQKKGIEESKKAKNE